MKQSDFDHLYDIIIIGGGPAGYTAALYAARAGLDALVLEKFSAGGQMALTHQIDNYPGFEQGIDGFTLAEKMKKQAERFGAVTRLADVKDVKLDSSPKLVETQGVTFRARAVVLATGAQPRELGLEKEQELRGRGVTYCASCDGMFYRGRTVVVVGGGDSAVAEALLLSRIAKKVILVHRRDTLRATRVYHDQLQSTENIELRLNSRVVSLLHEQKLTGVVLEDVNDKSRTTLDCEGIFISVGRKPATEFLSGKLELDGGGYVVAGEDAKTSIPGVFAIGDVRTKSLRQIVTAVADGAIAIQSAEEYLNRNQA